MLPRLLLALSGLILLTGAVMHTAAFDRTALTVSQSNLAPFYANSLKALWLIDSATLLTIAAIFAYVALRPSAAAWPIVILLAIIPASTACLLYNWIGNFIPAHMLVASAVMAGIGGWGLRAGRGRGARS